MYMRNFVRLLAGICLSVVLGLTHPTRAQTTSVTPAQPAAQATEPADAAARPAPTSSPGVSPYRVTSPPTVQTRGTIAIRQNDRLLSGLGNAVLVVPSGEPQPEHILSLNEDLTVMCRIFDRLLSQAGLQVQRQFAYGLFPGGDQSWLGRFFGEGSDSTECLYVEGYGPVFLMNVGFPLTPPPQDNAEKDANEAADPLWNQVRQETYAPQSGRGARSGEPKNPYSAEKVRSLKETLVRALKHAANIRGLDKDAWVTVTARGPSTTGDEPYGRGRMGRGANRPADIYGDAYMYAEGRRIDPYTGVTAAVRAQPAAMLTIRAKVQDVSALASGKLDQDEFQKRVEITEY